MPQRPRSPDHQLGRVIIPVSDQDKALESTPRCSASRARRRGLRRRRPVARGGTRRLRRSGRDHAAAAGRDAENDAGLGRLHDHDLEPTTRALKERGVDVDDPMGRRGPGPVDVLLPRPGREHAVEVEESEA